MVVGLRPFKVFQLSDIVLVLSNKTHELDAVTEYSTKCAFDLIKTHSQLHHTDKYSQHSSIVLPVGLNG